MKSPKMSYAKVTNKNMKNQTKFKIKKDKQSFYPWPKNKTRWF